MKIAELQLAMAGDSVYKENFKTSSFFFISDGENAAAMAPFEGKEAES